jgi:hypothetical protein
MKYITLLLVLFMVACVPVTPAPVTPTVTSVPPTIAPVTPSGDSQFLPDPVMTPGELNPAVSQDTIQNTICVPGYSGSIRPPVSYTDALKVKQIALYGYTDTNTADYEEDHFIPLSVGGNPTDPKNLWPQPRNTSPYNAAVKDTLEYTLYKDVCAGTVTLADAQQAIVTDWVQAYRTYVSGNLGISLTPEP